MTERQKRYIQRCMTTLTQYNENPYNHYDKTIAHINTLKRLMKNTPLFEHDIIEYINLLEIKKYFAFNKERIDWKTSSEIDEIVSQCRKDFRFDQIKLDRVNKEYNKKYNTVQKWIRLLTHCNSEEAYIETKKILSIRKDI